MCVGGPWTRVVVHMYGHVRVVSVTVQERGCCL